MRINILLKFLTIIGLLWFSSAVAEDADGTYFISLQPKVEVSPGVFFEGSMGGTTAPLAYYPNVTRSLTDSGLNVLKGTGTFQLPQSGSALSYRTALFAGNGAEALKAFYTSAIQAFTPQLGSLLEAEELFRTALRVDPYYEDALNGLLEVYYARAEGFMLIGNDYMAKAYRHKFVRSPQETSSITDLEIADIGSALTSYEIGFREFMKLFTPEFIGVNGLRKSHLDIDPETLFFKKRLPHPDLTVTEQVAFEALRGQKAALGVSTKMFDPTGIEISPVQGSPSLAFSGSQSGQIAAIDVPVKFTLPIIEGAPDFTPGSFFTIRFEMDIDPAISVKDLELLIEFDHDKLIPPATENDFDFTFSHFTPISQQFYPPGSIYGQNQIFANQMLLKFSANTAVSGIGRRVVSVPFQIKSSVPEFTEVNAYVAGSGGSLLSGYKDISILYRLAAAHADATTEIVKRMYTVSSPESNIALIQEEIDRIGGWFEHIQLLLENSAAIVDLQNNEQLQNALSKVSSEINELSAFREFIRSGANVYGYPDDYVPFFNDDLNDTFTAIRNLVVGSGTYTSGTAQGFFGTARDAETTAIQEYGNLQNTKDRIRNELFTINENVDNRLVQICGRVNEQSGLPSLNVNDPIDVDLRATSKNLASEIGQHVLLLSRAQKVLNQATEDYQLFLSDIEKEKEFLQDALQLHENKTTVMAEYSLLQQNLDKELAAVAAKQTELNAVTQALSTVAASGSWDKFITGGVYSAAAVSAIQLANGIEQARLEKKKGDLSADKTRLASEERIQLTQIDTEIFKLQSVKNIEQMVNRIVLKTIAAEIAEIDVQVALGRLNQLITERDNLLLKKGRSIANLGEMSFADPSFRLTQFSVMKKAENNLEYLKKWIFILTRSVFYKWALPDNFIIEIKDKGSIKIDDIKRLQVVGALTTGTPGVTPLADTLTASEYLDILLDFNDSGPFRFSNSTVQIDRQSSNNSARYSLREDFLHIVRHEDTPEELARVRAEFSDWLSDPNRLDTNGNLVIEFDTMGHLENYNKVVDGTSEYNTWKNFALRSYGLKSLWNHKITRIGVGVKAFGLAFTSGNSNISGSLEYGGVGYLKQDTDLCKDFRAYQMRQWRSLGNGQLEPVEYRTVPITIYTSSDLEASENTRMVNNLKERPVAATKWRFIVSASQLNNLEIGNIEDIYIYIYSEAYQRQGNVDGCL
jgi:hypothetical protein